MILLLLAAAQPGMLLAQYQKYAGKQVENIRFDPVGQPLEAEELHEILPLKMRQPLRRADVRASIERLFATGRYTDIQVEAMPYNNGVAIVFHTQERWFIGDVHVFGDISNPPTAGQVENAARLDLGTPYSDAKLLGAIEAQTRLLDSNGLYGSRVVPALDFDTDAAYQQVNLRFHVDTGQRAHFAPPVLLGDIKLDPARIVAATHFRRWLIGSWKPMTQTRVRRGLDGIRTLYQKENRLEARISLDSIRREPEANRAIPSIRIDAGPRIVINTIGVKLSRRKLQRYVPVYEEHAVDHDLLTEGARNLQDYFQSRGYFEAQVQVKEQRVTNDRADIDFLINEGRRHRLAHIGIGGNRYFSAEAIRERMFLQTATFLQFPHGRYSESLLRRDVDSIRSLYESNGFREVAVTPRTVDDYQGRAGDLAVFIDIVEGPQTLIAGLEVTGVEKLNKADLLSRLSSVEGQPFSEFNVAVDRDAILAQYFERGFPNATFEWSSRPAAEPNRVDLRYVVNEGEEQLVRQVVATGLRITRASLVNRQLTLNPGDPLSPTAMADIQRRLYDLGVFAKVDMAIQDPEGETQRKYILYNVEEARRYSVAVGFGAYLGRIGGCRNCFEAPAGAYGVSPRVSLDVTRNNLWGIAHSISLRTRVSFLEQRALLNYSWPRFENHENLNVSFTGLYESSRDVRTADFRRQEVSAQLAQKLSKPTTLFYRFTYRRVAVSNLRVSELLLGQLSQPVRVGLPSLNMVQDRRDDPLDPHRGIYNTLDIGLADRVFGSQRNFVRFLGRNSSYHSLTKRLVLARSTEFGLIHAFTYACSG
ncbi:MAG: BamA/TamA family outer membrane protein, partial [Acidobacteriia bacterium]|nr:BamA/TamA family outer membrane protein [Terriglobia bacterium]